jgi:TM2 domain-containing membrane protein YozV
MYCSYHPSNPARVGCAHCKKPLCSFCDHRIKGYPYCQDCIVRGIDVLSKHSASEEHSGRRGIVAALFGLIPGLGAAYNRQNIKAIFHFIGVTLLFQLSEIRSLDFFFALAGTAFYLYTIVDAHRTGKRVAAGEDPALEETRFKRFLAAHVRQFGFALFLSGVVLLIELVRPFGLEIPVLKLLPVALILFGGYLLVSHLKRTREEELASEPTRAPYPLFPVPQDTERVRRFAGRGSGPADRFEDRR